MGKSALAPMHYLLHNAPGRAAVAAFHGFLPGFLLLLRRVQVAERAHLRLVVGVLTIVNNVIDVRAASMS
jgi:hypothetical protein